MSEQADLAGRHVLVTGGCSGIGLAIVAALKAAGAGVAVFDRTIPDEFASTHSDVICIKGDVTDPARVRDGFGEAAAALGGLDCVVVNAGVSQNRPTLDLSFEDWRRVMSVNLDGAF
jgi:NAD(P)-dependent dehydrogenase (short-subunit alcohol dehydrogenase family)